MDINEAKRILFERLNTLAGFTGTGISMVGERETITVFLSDVVEETLIQIPNQFEGFNVNIMQVENVILS